HANGDQLFNFEHLRGSRHDDWLYGTSDSNIILGEEGDDWIEGRGGGDHMDGGDGADTLSYASSNRGVVVRLWNGTGERGHAAGDTFTNFENVLGSAFDDVLVGDDGDNVLMGGDGDDELHGHGGEDILMGGAGDDRLFGGEGADLLDGGDGVDTADYSRMSVGVDVRLHSGLGDRGAAGDVLVGIENVVGTRA